MQISEAHQKGGDIPADPKNDNQLLPLLVRHGRLLEMALEQAKRRAEEEAEDSFSINALPPDSDDILRYETAAQKQFDWALQKLLESQEKRRKAQASPSVPVSSDQ